MPDKANKFLEDHKDWEKITKSGYKLIEAKEHLSRLLAENERIREIIRSATVESSAEFVIISLTQDEYKALINRILS